MLYIFSKQPLDRPNRTCISCTQPADDSLLIAFTKRWKVILHPDQTALAACLIVAREHVAKVSQLSREDTAEFHEVYGALEPALEAAFGARLVNLSCERNWAYRSENPDPPFKDGAPNPHVHWHVIPRYASPVSVAGEEWRDAAFGDSFRGAQRRVSREVASHLISKIRSCLSLEVVA